MSAWRICRTSPSSVRYVDECMSCSARRFEGEAHSFEAALRLPYLASAPLARASGPVVTQDTLSDVLRGVRLRGAVFFNVSGSSDWAAEAPAAKVLAPMLMRGVDHVIEYHALALSLIHISEPTR